MKLYQTNPTLYYAAKRMRLGGIMEALRDFPNYEARLKVLYRLRAEGHTVELSGMKIHVDRHIFSFDSFDTPDQVRAIVNSKSL